MRAERVPLTPVKNKMVAAEVAARRGPVGNAGLLLAAAELGGRAGPSRAKPSRAGGCLAAPRCFSGMDGFYVRSRGDREKRVRP